MFFNDHNIQIEKMEIKSKVLLPGVFFGYYFPILSKFYFNANLGLNCGKINSVYATTFTWNRIIMSHVDPTRI